MYYSSRFFGNSRIANKYTYVAMQHITHMCMLIIVISTRMALTKIE
jgi:hypothetical protein